MKSIKKRIEEINEQISVLEQPKKASQEKINELKTQQLEINKQISKMRDEQNQAYNENSKQITKLKTQLLELKEELFIEEIQYKDGVLHTPNVSVRIPKDHTILIEQRLHGVELTILKENSKTVTFKTMVGGGPLSRLSVEIVEKMFDKLRHLLY